MLLNAYNWVPQPSIRQKGRPSKLDQYSEVISVLSEVRHFTPRQIAEFLRAHGVETSNSSIYYHLDKLSRNPLTQAEV